MLDTKDNLKDKSNLESVANKINESQRVSMLNDDDIHQMPEKFLPQKGAKSQATISSGSQKNIFIMIFVLVAVLVIIIGGAILFLRYYNNSETETPSQNANIVQEESTNTETEEEVAEEESTATSTEETSEEESTATSTEETSEEEEEVIVIEDDNSLDKDNDKLTLLEEELFGTDSDNDDSDKDGYKDGSEILNLYNPLASSQLLVDSGLVTLYSNGDFDYEILMPSEWISIPEVSDLSIVKFLTNSITGESVTVKVNANETNWDLAMYRVGLNDPSLQNFEIGDTPALISQDGKTVYTINDNFLYEISYDTNGNEEDNFSTVFSMMINSFVMQDTEVIDLSGDNSPPEAIPSPGGADEDGEGEDL